MNGFGRGGPAVSKSRGRRAVSCTEMCVCVRVFEMEIDKETHYGITDVIWGYREVIRPGLSWSEREGRRGGGGGGR